MPRNVEIKAAVPALAPVTDALKWIAHDGLTAERRRRSGLEGL